MIFYYLFFLFFGVVAGCILTFFFGVLPLPFPPEISWITGGILSITGLVIAVKWNIFWRKEYKGQLVTHGMYQHIRHPHYLAGALVYLGASILFRSTIALSFAALYLILTPKGLKEEEEQLIKQYGDAYREYKKKVPWKLIPKIW